MSQFLTLFPLALLIAIALTSIYVLCHAIVKKSLPKLGHTALVAAFFAYIFVVLSVTIIFRPENLTPSLELDPIASYRRAANAPAHLAAIEIRNIILNIAMFVPLGIFLPLFSPRLRRITLALPIALLCTLAIETVQIATQRGVFSIEDMLHNTLGAATGLILFSIFSKILKNI